MRLAHALLALSLAANLVLLAVRYAAAPSDPVTPATTTTRDNGGAANVPASTPASTHASTHALPAPEPADLAVFVNQLRFAGLPERALRALIDAEIDERFRVREAALLGRKQLAHWWQSDPTPVPLETRRAQLELRREKSRLRFELLGPDPETADADSLLSPAKQMQAYAITADYRDILREIGVLPSGHRPRLLLPAEAAAIKALEAQRDAELAALLTPGERAHHELRTSPALEQVRQRLHGFEGTDEELRAVFAFFRAQEPANRGRGVTDEMLGEQLKAALGEKRYAEFEHAYDFELNNLRQLVARTGLPADTTAHVQALRLRLQNESHRIADDPALASSEKKAALSQLAQETRAALKARLGAEAGPAYFQRAEGWLASVESGNVIRFNSSGWGGQGLESYWQGRGRSRR